MVCLNEENILQKILEFDLKIDLKEAKRFEKLITAIFELEFYKNKIDIEEDRKICPCYKKLYKFVISIGEYILVNKYFERNVSTKCIYKLIPRIQDVDVRAKMLAYVMLRPLIKEFINYDFEKFYDNTGTFMKSAKLILSGIHLNCENIMCKACGEEHCIYYEKHEKYCCNHKCVVENGEYIRFYIFPFIVSKKSYWIRYCFKILDAAHKDLKKVKLIIDYKNMPPEFGYVWNEQTITRFNHALEKFGEVKIINYEGRVDFGKYADYVKPYLSTEEELGLSSC